MQKSGEKMPYDYSKLSGRIVEKYETQAKFADAMALSEHSISLKPNGKVGWKQSEIAKACKVLEIALAEIPAYFLPSRFKIELNTPAQRVRRAKCGRVGEQDCTALVSSYQKTGSAAY